MTGVIVAGAAMIIMMVDAIYMLLALCWNEPAAHGDITGPIFLLCIPVWAAGLFTQLIAEGRRR